jgi:hypothetical protein
MRGERERALRLLPSNRSMFLVNETGLDEKAELVFGFAGWLRLLGMGGKGKGRLPFPGLHREQSFPASREPTWSGYSGPVLLP